MRIGIDAGGTFTDFVILHDDGRLEVFKLRSTSSDPASVILQGIQRASPPASTEIVHGSTVATNALLERKGARTAFVTSPGFRDLLELRTCVAWDIENVIFRVNDKGNKQISSDSYPMSIEFRKLQFHYPAQVNFDHVFAPLAATQPTQRNLSRDLKMPAQWLGMRGVRSYPSPFVRG